MMTDLLENFLLRFFLFLGKVTIDLFGYVIMIYLSLYISIMSLKEYRKTSMILNSAFLMISFKIEEIYNTNIINKIPIHLKTNNPLRPLKYSSKLSLKSIKPIKWQSNELPPRPHQESLGSKWKVNQ